MGKPFRVEIECGTGAPVIFSISEEEVIGRRDPAIASMVARGERIDYRTAAFEVVRRMIVKNVDEPINVADLDSVWIIPTHAIRWARMTDPELSGKGKGSIGFTMRGEEDEAPAE